jgi:hypothetical protein
MPDGSKSIKVGTRIGILAERDDDISSLELPAEEASKSSQAPSPPMESSESQSKPSASPKKAESSSSLSEPKKSHDTTSQGGELKKQKYPLYPSVSQLLHENGLSKDDADKIPASGPQGRLLKGDVLGYLGVIKSEYASEQSNRIEKLGHLDLSNIKLATPKKEPTKPAEVQAAKDEATIEPDLETKIAVSISFQAIREVQQRISSTLGIDVPLSTFVSRAIEISNQDLPRSMNAKASANELFDQVLGLNDVDYSSSRGSYTPQIIALPTSSLAMQAPKTKSPDIIDILTGTTRPSKRRIPLSREAPSSRDTTNVFSVTVAKGEEKRARVFLERIKTILQVEPGSLIL